MPAPYNPLDKINLGKSVAEALLGQAAHPLSEVPREPGAGIYAIYYSGPHPAYQRLAQANRLEPKVPIYVGKAIPSGGRRGNVLTSTSVGNTLSRRLQEHAESISQTVDLELTDFDARSLVVDDIWIPLGETLLITKFRPVWNALLDGFGNHDPGSGRYNGLRPLWDTLHIGRAWAQRCAARSDTAEQIITRIDTFLAETVPTVDESINFDPSSEP